MGKRLFVVLAFLSTIPAQADAWLSPGELFRRHFSSWGQGSQMPEPSNSEALLALLRDPVVQSTPSRQQRGWHFVGYNLLIDPDCPRLLGATPEEIGRRVLETIRKTSSCLLDRASAARRRDGRRLLGLVQPGGVRVRADDLNDRRAFRLFCDTDEEAQGYADTSWNGYTEQWWDDHYPSVNIVGSRMEDFGITNWIQFEETLGHEMVHLLGYRHDGADVDVPYLAEACCAERPDTRACELLDQASSARTFEYGKSFGQILSRRGRARIGANALLSEAFSSGDFRAVLGLAHGIAQPVYSEYTLSAGQVAASRVFGRMLGELALRRLAATETNEEYWQLRRSLEREVALSLSESLSTDLSPVGIKKRHRLERFVELHSQILSGLGSRRPDYRRLAELFREAKSLKTEACVQLGWNWSSAQDRESRSMPLDMAIALNNSWSTALRSYWHTYERSEPQIVEAIRSADRTLTNGDVRDVCPLL